MSQQVSNPKRILIAPLDWGLGHATRCIPIIRLLQELGVKPIIAADGGPLTLLKQEFPNIETIELEGYRVRYPKSGKMAFKMLFEAPRILAKIKKEHKQLQEIIEQHKIDAVISDNRFGLYTDKVPCIFITHQVHIQAPMMSKALYKMNASYLEKYNECWVPDWPGELNLSGDLAHGEPMPENLFHIGPLSRFDAYEKVSEAKHDYDLMAMISGPEPQRTVFENLILDALSSRNNRALIVRGLPGEEALPELPDHLEVCNHLSGIELAAAIQRVNWVLARPGYSTLMDLACLGTKAVFVPTPGQTEQEYLAQMHHEKGHYFNMSQSKFDLDEAFEQSDKFSGLNHNFDAHLLLPRIHKLMEQL